MNPETGLLDRYIQRELDPASARSLAQAALDDPDLFEELTAVALAEAALESPATTDRALARAALNDEDLFDTLVASGLAQTGLPEQRHSKRPSRRWTIAITGALAAAAAGLLTFLLLRPAAFTPRPSQPARALVAKPGPTILLTVELRPASSPGTPIFRGDESGSRAPKAEGTVVSIEDGVATVNLGSIDGLKNGQQIGGIQITTVFRDHARGKVASNSLHVKDVVRVPTSIHLSAILEEVNALAASGNLTAARDMARSALSAGSPGETRQLLERLAVLDYQAGAADAARERYEVAVNNFGQPPAANPAERASTLASYGALSLMSGDTQRAGDLLQKALAAATDPALRAEILGNLGALAARRLDTAMAADYYRQALAQQPSAADRAIIEANLAHLNQNPRP